MDSTLNNWYEIKNAEQVDSPALVIYRQRVVENINTLKKMIDDPERLRPHVKTHKTKEPVQLMMEAGIQKFKCATIAEAEMLALAGVQDVLLAYQPVGPKINRFLRLIKIYSSTHFSCLVDNLESVKALSEAASKLETEVTVYIDLNLGMNRTGIEPGEKAIQLYISCRDSHGIVPVGLHAYDGHIKVTDFQKRTEECNHAFTPVERIKNKLIEKGFDKPAIVAGGSPTFPVHAKRKNVECSPGTFIYWDKGYESLYPEQHFLTAALVVTRIVSLPAPNILCLDLGHKSISAENELQRRVHFLNAPELKFVAHSEEHLVAETPTEHKYKVGDVLYGLPFHICPTVALYDQAFVVEDQYVNGNWNIIARGRRIEV